MKLKLNINLKNIPKPVRIAIAIVPAILLIAGLGYFILFPKYKMTNTITQEIAQKDAEISKSQSMADKLEEIKAENEKLKTRLEELAKQLPEEKEISVLLKQVTDLGIKSGLNIISWKPSQKRNHPSGIVYEVPFSIDLTGSYHRLGKFYSSLTKLDRIVNILDIKLSSPKPEGGEAILSVNFSALTFTAATEGGIANAGGKGGKK